MRTLQAAIAAISLIAYANKRRVKPIASAPKNRRFGKVMGKHTSCAGKSKLGASERLKSHQKEDDMQIDNPFDYSRLHTDALKQEHYDVSFQIANMQSDIAQTFTDPKDVPAMAHFQIDYLRLELKRIEAELDRREGK